MSKPPSILMIDDHKPNLTALEATLDGLGAELVFAQSGEEALDILLQQDPDEFALILLDVQMPGMNGFETAQYIRMREQTSHIPIIFVTALSTEKDQIFKGYGEGAVDYLLKPIETEILRTKVKTFLDLYNYRTSLITEVQAKARIEEEAKATKELSEQKQKFLSRVTHDLRTPLNSISGLTALLEETRLSLEQERFVGGISASTAALLIGLNDFLATSDGLTIPRPKFLINTFY